MIILWLKEQQEQIEAAFRDALPNLDPERAFFIPSFAHELARMRRVDRVDRVDRIEIETAVERLGQTVGPLATRKELDNLFAALDALHQPAAALFQPGELSQLKARVLVASSRLDGARTAGRPKKDAALAVAIAAGEHYFVLTDELPTVKTPYGGGKPHGAWIDLLASLFSSLGIDASVADCAKKAAAILKRKYPPKNMH